VTSKIVLFVPPRADLRLTPSTTGSSTSRSSARAAAALRVFPRVYRGAHLSHPAVTALRAHIVTLEPPGVTGYADGEPFGPLPLTAEAVAGAVRVLAPGPGPGKDRLTVGGGR